MFLPFVLNFQGFLVVAFPLAAFTGDVDIWEKMAWQCGALHLPRRSRNGRP